MPRSPQWSLSLRFPHQDPIHPLSPHPYAPHAQPISFFSILSLAQYWVRSTNHLAPRYAISSILPYLVPPRSKYSPQYHVLKHPQLPFLPQCQRPSFTPIQNNRQNFYLILYTSIIYLIKHKNSSTLSVGIFVRFVLNNLFYLSCVLILFSY